MATLWPPGTEEAPFPQVSLSSYRAGFVDTRISTAMDTGVVKRRNDVTKSPERFDIPMMLDGLQLDVFNAFMENIGYGATRFGWTDPRDDSIQEFEFVSLPNWQEIVSGATKAERRYQATMQLLAPVE